MMKINKDNFESIYNTMHVISVLSWGGNKKRKYISKQAEIEWKHWVVIF